MQNSVFGRDGFRGQYFIDLELFQGPMDLLLHLVKQREFSVENVEMSLVAERYLEIISNSRVLDLDIASEYLVVAATLVAIKSNVMLAESTEKDSEVLEHREEFYEELRTRLRLYELTKARAEELLRMPILGQEVFPPGAKESYKWSKDDVEMERDSLSLGFTFISLLGRIGELGKKLLVQLEPITISDVMIRAITNLKDKGIQELSQFFALVYKPGSKSRDDTQFSIVVSFVALLEMINRGLLKCEQTQKGINVSLTSKKMCEHEMSEILDEETEVILFEDYREKQLEEVSNG